MLEKIPDNLLVGSVLSGALLPSMFSFDIWLKIAGLLMTLISIGLQAYKTWRNSGLKKEIEEIRRNRAARGNQLDDHESRLAEIESRMNQ